MALYIDIEIAQMAKFTTYDVMRELLVYLDANRFSEDAQCTRHTPKSMRIELMNEELIQWIYDEDVWQEMVEHITALFPAGQLIINWDVTELECGYTWSIHNLQSGAVAMVR